MVVTSILNNTRAQTLVLVVHQCNSAKLMTSGVGIEFVFNMIHISSGVYVEA